MNIISCDHCGVVLDVQKLEFPVDDYSYEFEMDKTKSIWDNERREHVPFVPCPVCSCPVLKP